MLLPLFQPVGSTAAPNRAQESDTSAVTEGASLAVYLVTVGPGRRVWERFGHNALLLRDTLRGIDRAYNYGMFSFEQEGFATRLVRGEMLYWMEGFDGEPHLESYAAQDRSIWIQELNLEAPQRADLLAYLEWNERPENRSYRYDYYRDNCSTRVRDALDRVLGGRLYEQTGGMKSGTTYRGHTRRLLTSALPAYVVTLLALGQPVDRPISAWQEMFLPVRMRETVRGVSVFDADGREVPLVRAEFTVYEGTAPAERQAPPNWLLGFLAVGVLVSGGLVLAASVRSAHCVRRVIAVVSISLWAVLSGLCGVLIVYLWGFTEHWAVGWNENLFFLNPIALPLAVLVPLAAGGRAAVARWAARLSLALVVLSALGVTLQMVPGFDQVNGEIIAVALPLNLATAWATSRWCQATDTIRGV